MRIVANKQQIISSSCVCCPALVMNGAWQHTITINMETIDKSLVRSRIYQELRIKYFLKWASPLVLFGFIFFSLWFAQMVVATASVPVVVNILR